MFHFFKCSAHLFLYAFFPCCPPPPLLRPDKAGFGNNFTTGDNKSVAQNMEAVVVGCMFKSLITRCASTTHELHSPENLVSDPSLTCSTGPVLPLGMLDTSAYSPAATENEKHMSHTWEFATVWCLDFSHFSSLFSSCCSSLPSDCPLLLVHRAPPLYYARPLCHHFSTCLLPSSSSFSSPLRVCTATSASWCSSSRRPMAMCFAGWHWVLF